MSESIQSIKERLKAIHSLTDPTIEEFRQDSRKGVKQALVAFENRLKRSIDQKKISRNVDFEKKGL